MREQRTVALLFGGQSPEHEISIKSASKVGAALDRLQSTQAVPIYITRAGRWHWPRRSPGIATEDLVLAVGREEDFHRLYQPDGISFAQALLHLLIDEFVTVFIMLHGSNGEDGRLQGAFELAGIRYTGSGSAASALALDKSRCQAYLEARGLPVPRFMPLQRGSMTETEAVAMISGEFGFPCVVKPSLCGSSVGVTIVRDRGQLEQALQTAFEFGSLLQIEEYVHGREFTCGVLDLDKPTPLPVTEIIISKSEFFDYAAKYTPGMTREVTPAQIEPQLAERIQDLAIEAHRSIGCEGFSRVDFMCDAGGPKILEVNTIPGMTETSLLPQAAAAVGIPMPELVRLIIEHSLERDTSEGTHSGGACSRPSACATGPVGAAQPRVPAQE